VKRSDVLGDLAENASHAALLTTDCKLSGRWLETPANVE